MRFLLALLSVPACMAQTSPFLVHALESGMEPAVWIFAQDRAGVRYEERETDARLKTTRAVRPDGIEIRTFDNERLRSTRKGTPPEPFGDKCLRAGDVWKGSAQMLGYKTFEIEHAQLDHRDLSSRAPALGCVALKQKTWKRGPKGWRLISTIEAKSVYEGELPLWLTGVSASYKEVSAADLDAAIARAREAVHRHE